MEVVIIGGFPRAGTRQFADILNRSANITIKGEYYLENLAAIATTFEVADLAHKEKWSDSTYRKWRLQSALNTYASVSNGSNAPFNFSKLKVSGLKCPRAENEYEKLAFLFYDKKKIKYFFCVRNLTDNFLSLNSTFKVSAKNFTSATISSIKNFFLMIDDERFDCSLLSLDQYIVATNKAQYINDNIFLKLDSLSVSQDEIASFIDGTKNRNSTKSATGMARRVDMSSAEKKIIFGDKELREMSDKINSAFNVDIYL